MIPIVSEIPMGISLPVIRGFSQKGSEGVINKASEKGSDAWWSEWMVDNTPKLLLFARQYTKSIEAAEEIVQQAVIRFWRSGRFNQENPKGYLYTCVRSSAIDRIRSEGRRTLREKVVSETKPQEEFFEDHLENDERQNKIQQALEKLPEEQREVLVMKIWGQLTFLQIAEVLETSINTISSRYRYALQTLKKYLDKEVLL